MRVLIVSTWYPSAETPGVAPFNLAHAKAIARHHDVQVVHAQLGASAAVRREEYAGLPVTRLPINPRSPLTVARNLNTLRKLTRNADVIHSMAFSTLGVLAPLYPMIAKSWVHTEHWSVLASNDHGRILALMKTLLRLPRRISAVSQALTESLRPFARQNEVSVIPNVIPDHFQPQEYPSSESLELVAVGALIERKRPVLAVETVAKLVEAGEDASLTWIGDGPQRDQVIRRATDLGIADRINLPGAVSPAEVPQYIHASTAFFLPTRSETFLVSAAEALACGRPVVLSELSCVTDYVDASNGLLVRSAEPAAFATAVKQARDTFAEVSADQIRATVIPRFSEVTVADMFDQFYDRLEK